MKHLFLTKLILLAALCTSFAAAALNPKPFVVPELKEWKGKTDNFVPGPQMRIVAADQQLLKVAQQLADDYNEMFGVKPEVVTGKADKGDILLQLKADKKLGDEGYAIDIADIVKVSAPEPKGVYWATRTLLQMAEQTADHALPKGSLRDWPDYPLRGFLFDVGRKFFPMSYLRDLAKVMSYYKMNTLQVHLNDNGFIKYYDGDWDKTYAAFRLESDTYPGLTARDGFYTKAEFIDFQNDAADLFVEIIPEIDVPAHTLAISHYKPELGSTVYGMDHFNLSHPELYDFVDAMYREYLEGENPVFVGPKVHIGTDEYSNKDQAVVEQFRAFMDHYVKFIESYGKEPFVWAGLNYAVGETPVKTDNLTQQAWSKDFGLARDIIESGSKVISIPDRIVYIVPQAGYYQDYLDTRRIYDSWDPSVFNEGAIEPFHPALMGGMFAEWNDVIGNGVTMKDVHHRVYPALQAVATKTWNTAPALPYDDYEASRKLLSEAPGVNQLARVGNPGETVLTVGELQPGALLPIPEIGYGYTVEFDLEAAPELLGTPLLSSDNATFWLADPVEGKFAFSGDGYLNTFNFKPYPGEKLNVKIAGDNESTALYINGKLIEKMVPTKRYINNNTLSTATYLSTLVFPLRNAGNFKSKVTNLKVTNVGE